MSREFYRAREKKPRNPERDSHAEHDRLERNSNAKFDSAVGENRSVSRETDDTLKPSDIAFGPERPKADRAVPTHQRQRKRQQRQYQREVRQAVTETRTDQPVLPDHSNFPGDLGMIPDSHAHDSALEFVMQDGLVTQDGAFSDAPVLDAYFPDASAPEIPDAATSMRGAVDMPMTVPHSVTENAPVEIPSFRKSVRENGEIRNAFQREQSGDKRELSNKKREQSGGNRLKFDGEKRIVPNNSPACPEGDAKSPSLRGMNDKPLTGRRIGANAPADTPRPAKYYSDAGGRLRFDADHKPEEKSDSRTVQKRQAARRFSADTAVTENEFHFENVKPLSSNSAVTEEIRPQLISDIPVILNTPEDSEQQSEADAAETALNVAVPIITNAARRPAKAKIKRDTRLKFDEKSKQVDGKHDSSGQNQRQETDRFSTDAAKSEDERRPFGDMTPENITPESENTIPDSVENVQPKVDLKDISGENGGHLRFEDKEQPERMLPEKQRYSEKLTARRVETETPPKNSSNKRQRSQKFRMENGGPLHFETEHEPEKSGAETESEISKKKRTVRLNHNAESSKSVRPRFENASATEQNAVVHDEKIAVYSENSRGASDISPRISSQNGKQPSVRRTNGTGRLQFENPPTNPTPENTTDAEKIDRPQMEFQRENSQLPTLPEHRPASNNQRENQRITGNRRTSGQNTEPASPGKFRANFEEKTPKLTDKKPPKLKDDSQSVRNIPRLLFGIGGKVAPVSSQKQERQSANSKPVKKSGAATEQRTPGKDGQCRTTGQQTKGRLRFERKEENAPVSPEKREENGVISSPSEKSNASARNRSPGENGRKQKSGPAVVGNPKTAQKKETVPEPSENKRRERRNSEQDSARKAITDESELRTRTRPKQPVKSADDKFSDGNKTDAPETPNASRKRQRLHFEPEPQKPINNSDFDTEEKFTRKPPRHAENDNEKEPEAPPKKPRLRFEDQLTEKKTPSSEQTGGDTGGAEQTGGNADNPNKTAPRTPLSREDRQILNARRRVRKASRRLEKARSKIPVQRRIRLEREYDSAANKVKRRLRFESEPIPEGALTTPLPMRTFGGVVNSVRLSLLMKGHQKIRETERQNVGVEAAHKGELIVEQGAGRFLRWNRGRLRSKPYRAVRQAERALEREQVNLEWRRNLRQNPELQRKNALSKWIQKQKIKRKYAQAAREAKQNAQYAQNILNATGQIIRSAAQYIAARKSVFIVIAFLTLIVLLFSVGLTSCMAMLSGVQSSYISVSYMADEDDICEADLYYSEMETDLRIDIDETETNHPGYDEYRYNIGEISHNPYELLSYLSTKYNAFKFRRVKSDIENLFRQQYTLTRTVVSETRHDSEDEPYEYSVLQTTLTVRPLSAVIAENLESGEETERYALYMRTYGNRQAFSNPFDFAWIGLVSSPYGYRIHPVTGVKNLHRGVDIAAPEGTEIKAIQNGRVVSAGETDGYGLCVVIEDDRGYLSRYAHCSELNVRTGQQVERGDMIATVGGTGNSTGPRLHLEVMLNGEYLNPYFFVETGDDGSGAVPGGAVAPVSPGYPGEAPTDETFARMLAEAERYLGYPYVWGGSSPETSFDCSGYVSWVINHSGWNVGRLGAQALYNMCTPVSRADARPGDLIFFTRTYSAPLPVTHVGIYVGNNQMIHCGDPIRYTDITTNYWTSHFYAYGRLP